MSPKLRRLSSRDLLRVFRNFGFEAVSQRGSHVKVCRVPATGERQILTFPVHKQIAEGTLRAIFRQSCRFIPERELRTWFYSG